MSGPICDKHGLTICHDCATLTLTPPETAQVEGLKRPEWKEFVDGLNYRPDGYVKALETYADSKEAEIDRLKAELIEQIPAESTILNWKITCEGLKAQLAVTPSPAYLEALEEAGKNVCKCYGTNAERDSILAMEAFLFEHVTPASKEALEKFPDLLARLDAIKQEGK